MTKAPKTAPVRPRKKKNKATPETPDGVVRFETAEPPTAGEQERSLLFTVDGEEFTVPKKLDERIVYLGLDKVRSEGGLFAGMYLVELLLGTPRYKRLITLYEAQRLTQDQFDQVVSMTTSLFFERVAGNAEDPERAGKASES
ncbi:hypothetical protein ACFWPV_09805 [Streptomyces uncialis]|uniref:hypothetical protein n=1 Tax=Streptomyces uncialis TaxID=1048205 RepID=UPI0036564C1D